MQIDMTYKPMGLFTLFLPESKAGEAAWNTLAEQTEGTGKVLTLHAPSVIAQLRKAGYVVRLSKNHCSAANMEEILAELS